MPKKQTTLTTTKVDPKRKVFVFVLAAILGLSALTYVAAKTPVGEYVLSSFAKTKKKSGKECEGSKPNCGSKKDAICKGGDWKCVSNEKAANYNGTGGTNNNPPKPTKKPCGYGINDATNCTDVPTCASITVGKCSQGALPNATISKCKSKQSGPFVTVYSCCGANSVVGRDSVTGKIGCFEG